VRFLRVTRDGHRPNERRADIPDRFGASRGKEGCLGQWYEFDLTIQQLAVEIAANIDVTLAHERIRSGSGLQRTGQVIAEVDDHVRRMVAEIALYRFEGAQVAVNIGEDRDPHCYV
jgi:hypothetical protein